MDAARRMGFPAPALDDLAIVTEELASNLVKHRTLRGRIEAYYVADSLRQGIEVRSIDDGPGILDVSRAEADGVSSRGTNGSGLGAVRRLTDSCEIVSAPGSGTHIMCRKWLPLDPVTVPCPMAVSVRTRCFPGEAVCGDQYFVEQGHSLFTGCVIDGCGHGPHAAQAAIVALQYVKDNFKRPVSEVFEGVHRVCQGTRGAAMTFVQIDLLKRRYVYAGVGNVTLRVAGHNAFKAGVVTPGTLGVVLRKVQVYEDAWVPGSILFLCSDGVSDRWRNEEVCVLQEKPVQVLSEYLCSGYGRPDDDVTILVAR